MRNIIENVALLVIGMFLGATLFGGVAYAATGVLAERSTNRVFVDGREVEVDYSAQANPSVFSGVYTREAYNAAYTVLAGLRNGDETVTAPLCIGFQEDRWKLENMLGNLSNGYTLSLRGIEGKGMYEIYVVKPDREIARQYTAGLIAEVNALSSDREKVIRLNEYLCDKIIYDAKKSADLNEIASSANPVYGNCGTFASAMNDLCAHVGVPCVRVFGENHSWNIIYCSGEWSYTDTSLNDQSSGHNRMLFSSTTRKQIEDPAGVKFLQELLVPGSTN